MKGKILLIAVLLVLSGCAGKMYQTKGGYKRHHSYYSTDQSHKQAKAKSGETLWMTCSYYGEKFHGKPTSSGEPFDMYKLTCAHKELTFGTKLKVTDPDSGKSVEVKVNDRGPFIPGRDLDLSYAAAQQVGLVPYGVKKLQVEIIEKP